MRLLNHKFKRDIKGFSTAASDRLVAHDWPGNVRELRNVIERAMLLEETSRIQAGSLAFDSTVTVAEADPPVKSDGIEGLTLPDAERTLLIQGLERAAWNQSQAARLLGISRDTLRYKMKKFKLKQPPTG